MNRHVFDRDGRISARELEQISVKRWIPPTIGKGGHLVHAEPREDTPRRPAGGQPLADEANAANLQSSEDAHQQSRQEGVELGRQEGLALGRTDGYAQGFDQGFEQGRKEGMHEGLAQGRQQAQTQLDEQLAELNLLLTHITHALNEQDYQLEQALLNLVQEIARAVVGRELEINSGHIMKTVRAALAALPPSRDNVRIIVNPRDLALLEQAQALGGENWRTAGNEEIEAGGCRIETDQSLVDFTTGTRFRMMMEQILSRQLHLTTHNADAAGEFEEAPEPVVKPFTETVPDEV